jgi:hypothetical protein
MTEPTSSTVVAAGVALSATTAFVAPSYAQLALFVVVGVAGSALALSTKTHPDGTKLNKFEAMLYLATTAGMVLALTGSIAYGLERLANIPMAVSGSPLAFFMGARREWVLGMITGSAERVTGTKPEVKDTI